MSKFFKAELRSQKTKHPEGEKTVVVFVSDKLKKNAAIKAVDELKLIDVDSWELYKNPILTEDTEENYNNFQEAKQAFSGEQPSSVPDFQCATYPLVGDSAVKIGICEINSEFSASMAIVKLHSGGYSFCAGKLDSYGPAKVDKANAILDGLSRAVNTCLDTMRGIWDERTLNASISMIGSYARDNATGTVVEQFESFRDSTQAKEENQTVHPDIEKNDFIEALAQHKEVKHYAPAMVSMFTNSVLGHLNDLESEYGELPYPQMIEHVNSMTSVADLVDLGPLEEIVGLYFTSSEAEKTASTSAMERLADKFADKPRLVPGDTHQRVFYTCLENYDGLDTVTQEMLEEGGEKLGAVFVERADNADMFAANHKEYHGSTGAKFDQDETINNIYNVDFDDANSIIKTFLNIRTLRQLVTDCEIYTFPNCEKVNEKDKKKGETEHAKEEPQVSDTDNLEDRKVSNVRSGDVASSSNDSVSESDLTSELEITKASQVIEVPEVELDNGNPNMAIWNAAFKTDLKFTKQDPTSNRLSINPQYRQGQATKLFGPRGKGWGVDVVREWIEESSPIFIDGKATELFETEHHIEIELWYIDLDDGFRYSVRAYGETERTYWSHNYNRLIKNKEFRKKSLTDATGKALSMLGICGDVYMGEYDDQEIINRSEMVKAADRNIKRMEFDNDVADTAMNKAKSFVDKMATAPSLAEIKRLEKLAVAQLESFPVKTKDLQDKKQKLLNGIADKTNAALEDFSSDMKHKEAANG